MADTSGPAYLAAAGFTPHVSPDPAAAYLSWCVDGAAILDTGRTDADALVAGVRAILGGHLPPDWPPVAPGAVATNDDRTRQGYDASTQTLLSDADRRLDAHNDGAVGFADSYPDVLALLCVRPASTGGESFLVDGRFLVDAISRDPARRDLARFLWGTPIEQCARPADRPAGLADEIRSRRPVVTRTGGGRLTVRYNREYQRVLDDGPATGEDRAHLAAWLDLGLRAAGHAPRFLLQPGHLLIVDNYRVFHGREPYQGSERFFHRVLAFTDMSLHAHPYPASQDDESPRGWIPRPAQRRRTG